MPEVRSLGFGAQCGEYIFGPDVDPSNKSSFLSMNTLRSDNPQLSRSPGQEHNTVQTGLNRALLTGVGSVLLLTLLLLAVACSAAPVEQDPYARFRPAMKSNAQAQLDALGPVPIYELTVQLEPTLDVLNGSARIHVPNYSRDVWSYLLFRLYPMLEQYGGYMIIQNVVIDDRPTSFIYHPGTEQTAVRISLPEPLRPGQAVDLTINWQLEIPTWQDTSSIYALFGNSQGMTSLPLFYPSLSVYENDGEFGIRDWWTDIGSVRGDAAFNVTSLFVVTATLPADQVPVASGTLVTSTLLGDGNARHVWVTGPSREFLLHSSPQFSSAYTETFGSRVTSYWLPGYEAAGRAALQYAVASLRIFNDRYGEYPFTDMRVAPAPLSYRGMEYPQVSLVGVEVYGPYRNTLETLVAHEVAHQWWYQIVHNDPVNAPWIDEALAEYSIKLYTEALYGDVRADGLQSERWQNRVAALQNPSESLDQPVNSYASGPSYEGIIYSKGALFYDAFRTTMGDRLFLEFLQNYLNEYRYDIVDTADWTAAIAALENEELSELYTSWIQPNTEEPPASPAQAESSETEEAVNQ